MIQKTYAYHLKIWFGLLLILLVHIQGFGQSGDQQTQLKKLDKQFWNQINTNPDSALLLAREMFQIAQNISPAQEANVHTKIGQALMNLKQTEQAETEFRSAIAIAEPLGENKPLSAAYNSLGQIYYLKARYRQSMGYYIKAQNCFRALNNFGYAAMANNDIAVQLEALGQFDSAMVFFEKTIRARDSIHYKDYVLFSYQKISDLYAKLDHYQLAFKYLLEGIEYAEQNRNRFYQAVLFSTTGNLLLDNSINESAALDYFLEAQKIFQETGNLEKTGIINLYIGDVYHKQGNDTLALACYRKGIGGAKQVPMHLENEACFRIGELYREMGRSDSALFYYQKSIGGKCPVCPEISIHKALIESANVSLLSGDYSTAEHYLERAMVIAEEAQANFELANTLEAQARYHLAGGHRQTAIGSYTQALKMFNEMGLYKEVRNIALALGDLHYSKSDFRQAADYLTLAREMADTLNRINQSAVLGKLEIRIDLSRREEQRIAEAKAAKNKIQQQKFIRNYLIGGAIVLLLTLLALLIAYRRKRQDNRLLAIQKQEIEKMANELHETDNNKLRFFTSISHEIRTPLTLIKAPLEKLVAEKNDDPDLLQHLQLALNNTLKLQKIVDQILDLRQLDEQKLTLSLSQFDVIDIFRSEIAGFEGLCYQTQCNLNFKANTPSANIRFDRNKLLSIVNNVLSNAFKFNKPGGKIRFSVNLTDQMLMITISDTGIGIAPEHLSKLGSRYFQASPSNFFNEGSGIGLAFVKELVAFLGGQFKLESQPGEGTSVSINLPCILESPIYQETLEISIPALPLTHLPKADQPDLKIPDLDEKTTILIVEDNPELRQFIMGLFAEHYQVLGARDGHEGCQLAFDHLPDLIISDIMMPGLEGNELCRLIKNDIRTSHIPVLLLTAKDARECQIDGYLCGADDYLVKPFDLELLVQKVKNILQTRENFRSQFSLSDIGTKTLPTGSELDRELLKKCLSLIYDNLDNSGFTVELLAEQLSVSRKTLLRKFKTLTGKSPADLIRHTRMSQAAILLREQKLRVNEVSLMVGYEDADRFSNAFKQFFGVNPSGYCN